MSLYGNLFIYRQRNKSPFEDFLTEAWVDLLNRLSSDQVIDLFTTFFFEKSNFEIQHWVNTVEEIEGEFRWETQYHITLTSSKTIRRPDIVLHKGKNVVAIIENKISSGFTGIEIKTNRKKIKWIDQLALYAEWLGNNKGNKESKALILMTHITAPPENFLTDNSKYNVLFRSVCYWSDFFDWINKHGHYWEDAKPDATVLVNEFQELLKEKEMTTEEPKVSDFSSARLFLEGNAYNRIYKALRAARLIMKDTYKNIKLREGTKESIKIESYSDDGWIYESCTFPSGAWVRWGFWFGQGNNAHWQSVPYDPPVTPGDYAVVWIYPENTLIRRPELGLFPEWHFPAEEQDDSWTIPALKPIHTLAGASNGFTSAYSAWVQQRFEEAAEILKLDK